MKLNPLKRILALSLFYFSMSLLIFNCEKEDDILQEQNAITKSNVNFSRLKAKAIENDKNLMRIINKAETKRIESKANKTVYNAQYDFTINTNYAKVITHSNGLKNYTFGVYRAEDNGVLENLLLQEQEDHSFKVSLVQYSLTQNERNALANQEIVDVEDKITFVTLEDISDTIFDKVNSDAETCIVYSYQYQQGNSCDSGEHEYTDGSACNYWGNPDLMATSGGYVLTSSEEGCGDGGGSTNTDSNPNSNPNGSNQTISNGGGVYVPTTEVVLCTDCVEEFCLEGVTGVLSTLSITNAQACWLLKPENATIKQELEDYINAGGNIEFAIMAIEDLRKTGCGLLPTLNNPQDFQAPYTGDIGDEENPTNQVDHSVAKAQYELLLSTEGKGAAVNYLIETYSMDTFGPNNVTGLYTIEFIEGDLPEAHVNNTFINGEYVSSVISIENPLLTYYDFGYLTKAIKHELFHVFQNSHYPFGATTVNEREFEAYWYSIYRFRRLQQGDRNALYRWAKQVIKYYKLMTVSQQALVESKYSQFAIDFEEVCKEE